MVTNERDYRNKDDVELQHFRRIVSTHEQNPNVRFLNISYIKKIKMKILIINFSIKVTIKNLRDLL